MASARERTQLRGLRHQDYDQDETLLRWPSRTCVVIEYSSGPLIVLWLVCIGWGAGDGRWSVESYYRGAFPLFHWLTPGELRGLPDKSQLVAVSDAQACARAAARSRVEPPEPD
eukprot:scaffold122442_cov69-Phaeocystis_antarctica.AAC.7